jgi:hypothetical protein
MEERKALLQKRVAEMEMTPGNIERGFSTIPTHDSDYSWEYDSPWSEFMGGTSIHLGKRSSGWKFCWNFHKNRHYHDKESLLEFIRAGRVVNEYGEEIPTEEFIQMALDWGQPDGWVHNAEYEKHQRELGHKTWGPSYYDTIIDGLRVSTSTEFS